MFQKLSQKRGTLEFWLYFVVNAINCGSGQLVVANLAQISQSVEASYATESLLCAARLHLSAQYPGRIQSK